MEPEAVGLFITSSGSDYFWQGLKWMYLLAFAVYVGFAIIVLAQIRQMVRALSGGFDRSIKLIGWLHLAAAGLAFILAIVIL
jgi:hypothetical protein